MILEVVDTSMISEDACAINFNVVNYNISNFRPWVDHTPML